MKKKTFKDNESYFKFINKMKDTIDVISVRILRKSIKIEYEKIEGVVNE